MKIEIECNDDGYVFPCTVKINGVKQDNVAAIMFEADCKSEYIDFRLTRNVVNCFNNKITQITQETDHIFKNER